MAATGGAGQTRQRLLTAAAEEFIVSGYSGASMSRIASRLGLTKGAFGHHFPTKESILVAIQEHTVAVLDRVAGAAEEAFPESPVRACVAYFAGIAPLASQDPVFHASVLLFQDPSAPIPVIRPTRERLRTHLLRMLRRDGSDAPLTVDPDRAAQYLLVLLSGLLAAARFAGSEGAKDDIAVMTIALRGLGVVDAETVIADVLGGHS